MAFCCVHAQSPAAGERYDFAGWNGARNRRRLCRQLHEWKPGVRQLAGAGIRGRGSEPEDKYMDGLGKRGEVSRISLLCAAASGWKSADGRQPAEPKRAGQWIKRRDFFSTLPL